VSYKSYALHASLFYLVSFVAYHILLYLDMSSSTNDSSSPQAPVDTLSTIRRGSRATATILPDIMRKVNGAYYFNQRVYAGSTPGMFVNIVIISIFQIGCTTTQHDRNFK